MQKPDVEKRAAELHEGCRMPMEQARAFAAGAQAGAAVARHTIKRMQAAMAENALRSADYLRKAIKAEAELARMDAAVEREKHAHTDWVDDDVRVRHPRA